MWIPTLLLVLLSKLGHRRTSTKRKGNCYIVTSCQRQCYLSHHSSSLIHLVVLVLTIILSKNHLGGNCYYQDDIRQQLSIQLSGSNKNSTSNSDNTFIRQVLVHIPDIPSSTISVVGYNTEHQQLSNDYILPSRIQIQQQQQHKRRLLSSKKGKKTKKKKQRNTNTIRNSGKGDGIKRVHYSDITSSKRQGTTTKSSSSNKKKKQTRSTKSTKQVKKKKQKKKKDKSSSYSQKDYEKLTRPPIVIQTIMPTYTIVTKQCVDSYSSLKNAIRLIPKYGMPNGTVATASASSTTSNSTNERVRRLVDDNYYYSSSIINSKSDTISLFPQPPRDTIVLCPNSNITIGRTIDITVQSFALVCGDDVVSTTTSKCTLDGTNKRRLFRIGRQAIIMFHNINFINGYFGFGAGIYVRGGTINVINCTFTNHRAIDAGGAIYIDYYGIAYITNTTFYLNKANIGSSIYTIVSPNTIINKSLFLQNTANTTGGAIFVDRASNVTISKSTFQSNSAGATGGALAVVSTSRIDLLDGTIFSNNRSPIGSSINGIVGNLTQHKDNILYCETNNVIFCDGLQSFSGSSNIKTNCLDDNVVIVPNGNNNNNNNDDDDAPATNKCNNE